MSAPVRCCIVGGGPAGVFLGLLLARAGVRVVVLEKHADFLRDFRGDTVHPSTLQILDEMGLLREFEKLPHRKVERLSVWLGGRPQPLVEFAGLKPFGHLALAAQWDFLDMLAREGAKLETFDLRMRHEATGLVEETGRVAGVHVATPGGEETVRADLVVACDGRRSTIRAAAGLHAREFGAPMDALWFRMERRDEDPEDTFGSVGAGRMMVFLNRTDYWQVALVVPKGSDAELRAGPIDVLHRAIAELAPFETERAAYPQSWDDVKTLVVRVDRLERWWTPGLLLIGDAAHAMSPIGGVGINLAIQDAVAAANALAPVLRGEGAVPDEVLQRVQDRRLWPTKVTQRLQLTAQKRILSKVLAARGKAPRFPAPLRWLLSFAAIRRIPARLIGYGVRREHVESAG